ANSRRNRDGNSRRHRVARHRPMRGAEASARRTKDAAENSRNRLPRQADAGPPLRVSGPRRRAFPTRRTSGTRALSTDAAENPPKSPIGADATPNMAPSIGPRKGRDRRASEL